jgi:hypothetical protein
MGATDIGNAAGFGVKDAFSALLLAVTADPLSVLSPLGPLGPFGLGSCRTSAERPGFLPDRYIRAA